MSSSNIPCYKVILVGDCRVGKTSFLNSVIGRPNNQKTLTPTIGVEYAPVNKRISGQQIRINIWDTSGAQKYKAITTSYYRKAQGAVLMFDLSDRNTFISLKAWLQEIIKVRGTKISKIVLANKHDLVETGQKQRQVSENEIVDFCLQNQLEFKYTSAVTGYNINESFNWFIQKIHQDKNNKEIANIRSESSEMFKYNSISIDNSKQKEDHNSCAKCC